MAQPAQITPQSAAPAVEAILLSVDRPVSAGAIAAGLRERDVSEEVPEASAHDAALVENAVGLLNASYESTGRSFRIEKVAGGYRVMTLAPYAGAVAAFHRARQGARLSRAAVETLAIIAYKQPVTRATLEAIRGVSCGEVLKTLVERRLVSVAGRAEELGRPLLYGTTRQFLDAFGLSSVKDLPTPEELRAVVGV